MPWLDKLERRAGWLAFPGLFRFYVLFGALVHVLSWIQPDLEMLLDFDRSKIFSGEVWRLATFLFATDAVGQPSTIGVLFLFFAVIIGFLISDSLESAWGVFSTSLFLYCGYFALVIANLLVHGTGMSGSLFYSSAFFAFATLFPRHEFLLFFVLPVQVRFLALIGAALLAIQALGHPVLFIFFLFAFANYFLWLLPDFIRSRKGLASATIRRRRFEHDSIPELDAFHRCAVCGRTEHDDAHLEFRVGHDGKEYCAEHLPEEESKSSA
jgi:hypothetical protein